jgi:hypothetical protein
MDWNRFAFAALGVACMTAGALLPVTSQYLIPAGFGLLGIAVPSETAAPVIEALSSLLPGKKK